jgi:type IV pilus assembly protein PilV
MQLIKPTLTSFTSTLNKTEAGLSSGKSHGFTLLEVMVALFVLSLGLLGMAGMQLGGMQSTKSAYSRTQATLVAYDIIDRMRTNEAERDNYQAIDCTSPPSKPSCIGTSTGCSATDLASDDINEWCNSHVDSLPGGTGTVSFNSITSVYTITVGWVEQSDADDPNKTITANIRFD